MSALHGRLSAAIEEDRVRFSGEEFASARLGTVAGSVKRRRAVRSAGVGGASVLGASALAAGVINVPWGALGGGVAPGASPSVICTTTTPDAVPVDRAAVPEGATLVVIDTASDVAYFVGLVDGHVVIWNSDGTEAPIEDKEGPVELLLNSGESVSIDKDGVEGGLAVAPSNTDAVEILGVGEYLQQSGDTGSLTIVRVDGDPGTAESETSPDGVTKSHGPEDGATTWVLTSDSGAVAKAYLDGDVLVVDSPEGAQRVELSDDGGYHFTASGEEIVIAVSDLDGEQIAVVVSFGDEEGTVGLATGAAPEPVVDCVTPEPAVTGTPTDSPEPSVTPSTINDVVSAFACGFDFTTYSYEGGNVIAETEVTTQSAVRDTFLAWYGDQAPTTDVPDSDAPAWHVVLNPDVTTEDASLLRFVAVKDGVVVGGIDSITNTAPGYLADRDGDAPLEAFLWDRAAFTACGTATIDDAEIYAVFAIDNGDGVDFAWRPVE